LISVEKLNVELPEKTPRKAITRLTSWQVHGKYESWQGAKRRNVGEDVTKP
jgi:hypothetical protein